MQRIVNTFYEGGRNDPASTYHTALREWTLRRAEGHHAQGWSLCSDLERRRALVQTEGRSVVSSIIRGWCGHHTINRIFGSSCHRGSLTLRNGARPAILPSPCCSGPVVQTVGLHFYKRRCSLASDKVEARQRTLARGTVR